jgi:hypothetical protein
MVRRVTLHDEVEAAPISCLFRKTTLRVSILNQKLTLMQQ